MDDAFPGGSVLYALEKGVEVPTAPGRDMVRRGPAEYIARGCPSL
jgi:hypothetical protein